MINLYQPILLALLPIFGGLVIWFFKAKREESLLVEERAREYKIKTYETLLEPFIGIFTKNENKNEQEKYFKKLSSLEYRKAGFNLMTFGSDEVIEAYNDLMQHFYNGESSDTTNITSEKAPSLWLRLFSILLLSIRKDLYTKNTKLKRSQMLEFIITDIETIRADIDAD